jgi:predicted transcriptional regulator
LTFCGIFISLPAIQLNNIYLALVTLADFETYGYLEGCFRRFVGAGTCQFLQLGGSMKRDLDCIILTRQELQIMKVVWELGNATVKEVCDIMSQTKPVAYTTILTLMGILEEKGALNHTRAGRAFVYTPVLSRQQATRNQVRDVINRFFDGRPTALIEDIIENEAISADKMDVVRSLAESKKVNMVA